GDGRIVVDAGELRIRRFEPRDPPSLQRPGEGSGGPMDRVPFRHQCHPGVSRALAARSDHPSPLPLPARAGRGRTLHRPRTPRLDPNSSHTRLDPISAHTPLDPISAQTRLDPISAYTRSIRSPHTPG